MSQARRIQVSLLALRLTVFLVMLMWTLDKFVNPEHAGAVLILHAVSTFSSFAQYLSPWQNLLFFAAWPMLAACLALYLLREHDTLATIGR